jgi:hypothetical protein
MNVDGHLDLQCRLDDARYPYYEINTYFPQELERQLQLQLDVDQTHSYASGCAHHE